MGEGEKNQLPKLASSITSTSTILSLLKLHDVIFDMVFFCENLRQLEKIM